MNNPSLANTLFAASIHEIKNRFGLLENQLEGLLAELNANPEQQATIAHIRNDAQFIGSELVRVLSVFKAAQGQMAAAIDQQFVEDFLEEVVARHATTAKASGCQIRFDCDGDLTGFFDPGIITVVLDTCLYNAVKAGARNIVLRGGQEPGFLLLHVDDDGPGFPEEMLQQAIGPGRLKPGEGSTGLGLYFADLLLGHHQDGERKGGLALERSPEGGARVTLRLPE